MAGRRLFFFFTIFTLLSSCKSARKKEPGYFYWNIAAGYTSMDPAFARTQANTWIINQLFNGLIDNDASLQIIPSIAKSWEISSDGLRYLFHLRNDVYFQDDPVFAGGKGRKVTAEDFVYSFQRLLSPSTASPGAWIFTDKIDTARMSKAFIAVNDSTFEISLSRPFRPFLNQLTLKYCSVVPREAIEKYGKDFRNHPVGTGPFCLKHNYTEKLIFRKNPNYFEFENGERLPRLNGLVISFLPNKQNEFFNFLKGDLDVLSGIDQSFKDNILTPDGKLKDRFEGRFQFEKNSFLNTEYLGFYIDGNTNPKPLLNSHVRRAINYAIDRDKIVRYLRNNIPITGSSGFVPPILYHENKSRLFYSYNPIKAKEELSIGGFPEGRGIPAITIYTTDNYLDITVIVQKQLEEIGLKINVENVPASSLSEMKAKGQAGFFRGSWVADYADPENYLSLFYSKNFAPEGPNYFHFRNTFFDKLYELSLTEKDDKKRDKLYHQMEDIVMDEAPVVILYYDVVVRLKQNWIRNLNPNAINQFNLKRVISQ